MTVPPARQCTLPSCGREAVDPSRRGALCQLHHESIESAEPVTDAERSEGLEPVQDTSPAEDTSLDQRIDTADGDHASLDWTSPCTGEFPKTAIEYDAWVPTHDKRPFAPYAKTENRWSWSNPDNWTDFESAREWQRMHPRLNGLAFILQSDTEDGHYNDDPDPILFVDYDDAIDEETGEPCDEALDLMDRLSLRLVSIGIRKRYSAD